ncbi:hypothetical protein Nepgr_030931 [Nepenthes gracilis]|uniref:Uncharacterized protein n=1 Tax=Nepenthes gracilis TaxID=150966 RepID=A0AAD3TFP5_NEPGR|nr:hypothetical protein Nepgr_030931 [Nepenthes gracilis]
MVGTYRVAEALEWDALPDPVVCVRSDAGGCSRSCRSMMLLLIARTILLKLICRVLPLKTKSAALLPLLMQLQRRTAVVPACCSVLKFFTDLCWPCWACGDESKLMANARPVEDC